MDKKSFRKKCLRRVKSRVKSRDYISDYRVLLKIEYLLKIFKPKSLLLYIPMKSEANITKLFKKYRNKLDLFVPFIEGESFKMVKYRLPLKYNSFNIYQPPNTIVEYKKVDMIIVPTIGVDGSCKRVGFGKGMYDRFYEKLDNKPIVVFIQRVACVTKKVVTNDYDIHADYYITPKEFKIVGKYNDSRNYFSFRSWGNCRLYRCEKASKSRYTTTYRTGKSKSKSYRA